MTPSIRTRTAPTALLAAALAGCTTVGPDYRPPEPQVQGAWVSPVSSEAVDGIWWQRFDDPQLAELVEAAIAGNKDIEEAGARLREARANRDAIYGRELPQAGVSAIATQNRLSENGQLPVGKVPGLGRSLAIYDIGFDASWEIDLWGGTRRAIESGEARAQAAEEARRGVILQVIAEVVRAYIDLRSAQELRSNAIADAEAQAGVARLAGDRLRAGAASRLDFLRAEAQARSTAATIPAYESDAAAAVFRLALLVGQPPEALDMRLRQAAPMPAADFKVAAGLRSELLRRRPDIRLAERDLAASTADIGVATAELFPHLSLIGGIGLQARRPGDLPSDRSLRLQVGPSLRWPIFSGGRIRAQIRAADARADAARARYERAVLAALADSETSINRFAAAGFVAAERAAARTAAAEAVELARRRYTSGEEDLTALLQAQIAYSAADRAHIQAKAARLLQLAALYKALGGGWEAAENEASGQ